MAAGPLKIRLVVDQVMDIWRNARMQEKSKFEKGDGAAVQKWENLFCLHTSFDTSFMRA